MREPGGRDVRSFTICRDCCAVHPSSRGCPHCDGDHEALFELRRPGAPVDAPPEVVRPRLETRPRMKKATALSLTAVVAASVVLMLLTQLA